MANEAQNNAEPKGLFDRSVWERADNLANGIAEAIVKALGCDEVQVSLEPQLEDAGNTPKELRATFTPFRNQATTTRSEHLFLLQDIAVTYCNAPIVTPLTVNDLTRARLPGDLALVLSTLGVKSFGVFKIIQAGLTVGVVACFFKKHFHRWRSDELAAFQGLGELLPKFSSRPRGSLGQPSNSDNSVNRYQRLASRGNIVILTTDRNFGVRDIFGNTDELFGVASDQLRGDPAIWASIVDPRDAAKLVRRIKRLRAEHTELQEEVRVVHRKTGSVRWILLRALPYHDSSGVLQGWEGFGLDVTDRREAQDALVRQNARLDALFQISKALGELHDPAMVTLTGLRAVLNATRSEAGYAVFCTPNNGAPEVVAAIGLSEDYLAGMDEVLNGPSLLRKAIDSHTQFMIPDLQKDPRASRRLAQLERIHSAIIIPLTLEGVAYGGIVLFKRSPDAYANDDFDLAISAASQITLAIRQSEVLELQKRQSSSLGSLYTVSRELARYRAAVDFSDRILPTLRHEFALKRCWVGITNPQGTFIVGRAGFGPEVSAEKISMQIEISDDQPILQDVLHSRAPLVFDSLNDEPPEAILSLFPDPDSLVIVPMVTVGQAMGVLVLEPLSKQTFASAERLQLIVSMANEMATAMMAGRFESKMANAAKMQTAGLLASGVAHNFNNILQVIMGQVSLVQLHAGGSKSAIQGVVQASHIIQEAAMRGAELVRQLLSFATKGNSKKTALDLAGFLNDSHALYESLLGKEISFAIDNQVPVGTSVYADQSQLQQVLTSMLANSRDSLVGSSSSEVEISAHSVVVRASELAADLSPGSYIRIDIRDNGIGMTPEQQARCFEPFFTTKNVDRDTGVGLSGSGLGLAAAYATIKEHNGVITVHSKQGEGAIFSIYLPCYKESVNGEEDPRGLTQAAANGVLLLGIEAGVQPFIASALESLGYSAQGVFDLRQAHELLAREHDCWGVIIVDSEGLVASQQAICSEIAAAYPNLSVICLGAGATAGDDNLTPLGGDGERVYHLEKPVTGWALEAVMRRVLG
jgi:PAS domain S-box-containing protein